MLAQASDLFSVIVCERPRTGVSFLNWRITPTHAAREIRGAGLYALFFEEALIYVGMYRGKAQNPNDGQVAKDRWWAHLGSITMRGHRVSLPGQAWALIEEGQLNNDLAAGLGAGNCRLYKDNGCCTSINRLLFASSHWSIFCNDQGECLSRFKFLFVPAHFEANHQQIDQFRDRLHCIEKSLIAEWSPFCNVGAANGPMVTACDGWARMQYEVARLR